MSLEQLYRTFGDSWRISQDESLFVYGPGETTDTFTDRTFPDRPFPRDDLDEARRHSAADVCASAGVTEPIQLAGCIVDVAVTGQAAFAVNSGDIQANPTIAIAGGTSGTPVTPGPVTGVLRDGDEVSGEITNAAESRRYDIGLGGARDFYVADWHGLSDGCDQAFTINLVNVAVGNLPCTGQFVRFHIPEAGRAYQLEVASATGRTGPFSFRFITVKPRTFTVQIGDRIEPGSPGGAGTIDVRGREDVFEFAAAGATELGLAGLPECDADIVAHLRDVTDDLPVASSVILCGDGVSLALDSPDHRYALVVFSGVLGTGEYSFMLGSG